MCCSTDPAHHTDVETFVLEGGRKCHTGYESENFTDSLKNIKLLDSSHHVTCAY